MNKLPESNLKPDQNHHNEEQPATRPRKLQLHKEILRGLTSDELHGVPGGATGGCETGGKQTTTTGTTQTQ